VDVARAKIEAKVTTLQEKLQKLPVGRRKKIDERTAELVAED
jgi:hypothetical protein